jgi:hypothetical protein
LPSRTTRKPVHSAIAAPRRTPAASNIPLTPASGAPPYRIQQHGRDIPASDLPMQYAIAHRTSVSNEIEIVRADGTVLFVQNDVEPLYDSHGRIYGCVSVVVDLTFRKLAEIGLRDADRRKDEFLATLTRTAQPACADSDGHRGDAARARRSGRHRGRTRHDGARSSIWCALPTTCRRGAHHAEQDGSAARTIGCPLGAHERRRNHAREPLDARDRQLTI